MAPLDRGSQRALAGGRITRAAGQEVEAAAEPLEDRRGRERAGAGGGELDRERQPVEPAADLGDCGVVGVGDAGAAHKQLDRGLRRQRRQRHLALLGQPQRGLARDQHGHSRRPAQEVADRGRGVDELLEVVEHEQQLGDVLLDRLGELALEAVFRVDRRERDEAGAVAEVTGQPVRQLEAQPGLADAAGPEDRHHPVLAEQRRDGVELPLPADEAGRERGQRDRRDWGRPRTCRRLEVERRILVEHAALEPLQLGPGLDAELVHEDRASAAVGLQRVGLAARAVQREHQVRVQALPAAADTTAGRLLGPLRRREMRRLLAGSLVSKTGDWLTVGALMGWIFQETGSTGSVALLMLVRLAPPILGGGAAAALVDGVRRERLLVVIELLRAVALATVLAGLLTGLTALVYVAIAVSGLLGAISPVAVSALIPQLVPAAELPSANGLSSVIESAAMATGAVAGGLLLALVGVGPALALDLTTFILAAGLFAGICAASGREARAAEMSGGSDDAPAARLRDLLRDRTISTAVGALCITVVAGGLVNATLPRFLEEIGMGAGAYGFGFGAIALGLAVGARSPARSASSTPTPGSSAARCSRPRSSSARCRSSRPHRWRCCCSSRSASSTRSAGSCSRPRSSARPTRASSAAPSA